MAEQVVVGVVRNEAAEVGSIADQEEQVRPSIAEVEVGIGQIVQAEQCRRQEQEQEAAEVERM